ncbi:ABC-2 type transport system ATP-binding protein [Amphibacillus marinus]|uniref:ABC-2 type transport system ATP-binding protein n=1 Tax=Amphibacillus marinus TaxID=872970 RepID=A0A1H8HKL9_9BACI|nr:ABC transporter ATP-binding protein [Amphibacillus marinus]SEN56624.1 ABC-2 type transport system ATP-binding protein [Amphibacillus marinus]
MLKVNQISKTIKGKVILNNISLDLKQGEIYGFVGRNGSGKTMLFRALSGLMKIDSGDIIYNNYKLHHDVTVFPNLGITIENAGLYPEFTGFKNLQLLAKLNRKIGDQEIKIAIKRVGLDPDDVRTFRKYSLGMKQRIVLAQAIMEKPELILLDEPTNSLDEEGVKLIRQVIREEQERGAMVLLASHNKEDIKLLADQVYYLDSGRLVDEVYSHAK